MVTAYTFSMDEVRKILLKHVNNENDIKLPYPNEEFEIMALDINDKLIENTHLIQVFHLEL